MTFVSELIFFISYLLRFFKQLIVNCLTSSQCGLGRANSMCTLPIYGIHVIESTNICMCDDFMRHNMCTCVFMMFFTFFNTCIRIKHVHVFNPRFWSHFVSSRESFFFYITLICSCWMILNFLINFQDQYIQNCMTFMFVC